MDSNAAFEHPVAVDKTELAAALPRYECSAQLDAWRLSPRASTVVVFLLSLATWAVIWRAVVWLVAG